MMTTLSNVAASRMLPITASIIGSRQFGAGVVNLAARIEKLTSELGRTILASDESTPLLVVPSCR